MTTPRRQGDSAGIYISSVALLFGVQLDRRVRARVRSEEPEAAEA